MDLFSSSTGPSVGRMRYAPTIGCVRSFGILMQFLNWALMLLQKTVLFSSPSGLRGGAYLIRPYNRVRVTLRNTDVIPQPGTCEGSKNGSVYATVGDVWWAYSIRPYNWIRVVLRKTTPFSSPSVTSVGSIQYAPRIGYVRSFEIPMQFSNWVHVALQKTVSFSSPSGPRDGRIQYAPTTGYVRGFKKLSCIRHRRWRMVGRIRYAPTIGYMQFFEIPMQFPNWIRAALQKTVPFSSSTGPRGGTYSIRPYNRLRAILRNTNAISQLDTCGPLKNYPVFVPFGAARWAYSIRPYNRVRARVRNTDATPRPDTCDPSKYRCDLSTGWAGVFGRWGGGDYRLRGRWA